MADISIINKKIIRETLISTVLWLLYDFLSLKNVVNVPVFQIRMCLGFPDPHPDPLVSGKDPRLRIRTQIRLSWIRIRIDRTDPDVMVWHWLWSVTFKTCFCTYVSMFKNLEFASSFVIVIAAFTKVKDRLHWRICTGSSKFSLAESLFPTGPRV